MTLHEIHDALDELARAVAHEHHCRELAWGLVRNGALAASGGVGTLHDGRPPDEHTVFRIASMTKSFTAAAVLALRDEGVWSLDDPVARHAPELATVRGPDDSPAITLRHLLSMTAGLAADDAWADRHLDMSIDEIDRVYAAGPLFAHRTNDAFEYSNLGFGMIGRCVLRATGRRVAEHVTERFLEPLGMQRTTWLEPEHHDWARPYRWQDDAHMLDESHPLGDGEISPMGGIWATVHDLATWVGWLDSANTAPLPGPAGLSAASRREMQRMHTYIGTPELADVRSPTAYGLGLVVCDHPHLGKVVDHSGGLPGYGSNMRWVAGTGVGVVALANTTYAPMAGLTMAMLHRLHELDPIVRPPREVSPELARAADWLVALLGDWTDAEAIALFADNVALDESFERRAAAARRLLDLHGTLGLTGVHAVSNTNARLQVEGSAGEFEIEIDLAPLAGGFVQSYQVSAPSQNLQR